MNKPSWDSAPEWANYLAMDANGDWQWYETEPFRHGSGNWLVKCGRTKVAYIPCESWRGSLESRPK